MENPPPHERNSSTKLMRDDFYEPDDTILVLGDESGRYDITVMDGDVPICEMKYDVWTADLLGIVSEAIDGGIAKGKHRAVVNDGQGLEI
jgi:hypothetical protein